jgi:phosphoribosylaminoimidazolecarboxamide formyltransferase/IMP cyclohydrolase
MDRVRIKRALISVYYKTGLTELAQALHEAGVEIVSTGTTADHIRKAGVPVTPVANVTGFPEILGGRVKTLHPRIHGGLLADQTNDDHLATIAELGIVPFQLLISNLYPFAKTVADGGAHDEVIEQIDVGGPGMVRAGAKNHGSVAVVTDPSQYGNVVEALDNGGYTLAQRAELATAAFRHTAAYDIAVATYLGAASTPLDVDPGFPDWRGQAWSLSGLLRYGENPDQRAALYVADDQAPGIAQAEQLSGKEMSYNNYVDADAARRAAYDFVEPCVAIIKHTNPCGTALGVDIAEAHRLANDCDPVSAFGGVIATNRPVSVEMAGQVADIFTEVIVAPGYEEGAVDVLKKRKGLRVLQLDPITGQAFDVRPISGGLLVQTIDRVDAPGDDPYSWTLAAGKQVDPSVFRDLVFAWRAVRAVKSNAILLAHDRATVGIGMGQVNRVDSCRLAVTRAGDRAKGSVAASDAFFPFADGLQVLLDAGVRAVVQPGGSVRDDESIAAAKAAGISMYFTGTRHFNH